MTHDPFRHLLPLSASLGRVLAALFLLLGATGLPAATGGTVVAWGQSTATNLPPDLTNVVSLTSGGGLNGAVLADGTVRTWTPAGVEIAPPSNATNIARLRRGNTHFIALTHDGFVRTWGTGGSVVSLTNIIAGAGHAVRDVAATFNLNASLGTNGAVHLWGSTLTASVTNRPPSATGLIRLFTRSATPQPQQQFVGIRRDGTAVPWGEPRPSLPSHAAHALSNTVTAEIAGFSALSLKADGTLFGWGSGNLLSLMPANLSNMVSLSVSGATAAALRNDGRVFAWGASLSLASMTNLPPGVSNVIALAVGDNAVFATVGDGSPSFVDSMEERTVARGRPLILNALAVGQPPLDYQWRRDGVDLPGATNPILTHADTQFSDAGVYSVIVSNVLGVIDGVVATVSVEEPAVITSQPADLALSAGEPALFQVHATGTPAPSYQWFRNNVLLTNATNASLTFPYTLPGDAGAYRVVVSNYTGIVTSQVAQLTIGTNDAAFVRAWTALPVVSLANYEKDPRAARQGGRPGDGR